ncbi:MAG: hypothetical protein U0401_05230 [Anaerolineae bacterium]
MPTGKYMVSVNGFRCNHQSWDDAFNWDGKGDEVFIAMGYKIANKTGVILTSQDPITTPIMGDTWNLPNRIQAGSASNRGGIITGDTYPTPAPWVRSRPLDDTMDWPPYKVWEGDLTQGEDVVFLMPTIWEWDPGTSFWNTVLAWHVATDAQFGQRAKDVFAGRWPVAGWWFDAISLGIQTAGTLQGIWGGLGSSGNRPIGILRDPSNPSSRDAVVFNPQVLMLTQDMAEVLTNTNPFGRGNGILSFRYADDNYLAGDYSLYLQVEKAPGSLTPYPDLSLLKETSRPEVYVIMGGAPFHIPDPATLNRLYPPGWPAVKVVPDGTIATLPVLPEEGTILKEEHMPEVWRIEGAQKRHITSPIVLGRYGG